MVRGSEKAFVIALNDRRKLWIRLGVQGYLAHKKTPTPLGPPQDPRQRPTEGS